MRVLLGCEESQIVTIEFRKRGHEAYSCDIQDCSGGHPEWHIKDDILKHLNNGWDMMIAFPPCTHLSCSGAAWFKEKQKDGRQKNAIEFFMKLINADIEKICIENPIGIMSTKYKKPNQIIHPYYFGDKAQKATCLWLKNLPLLFHNAENDLFYKKTHTEKGEFIQFKSGRKMAKWYALLTTNNERGKMRSKTFQGIAKAMAEQWG